MLRDEIENEQNDVSTPDKAACGNLIDLLKDGSFPPQQQRHEADTALPSFQIQMDSVVGNLLKGMHLPDVSRFAQGVPASHTLGGESKDGPSVRPEVRPAILPLLSEDLSRLVERSSKPADHKGNGATVGGSEKVDNMVKAQDRAAEPIAAAPEVVRLAEKGNPKMEDVKQRLDQVEKNVLKLLVAGATGGAIKAIDGVVSVDEALKKAAEIGSPLMDMRETDREATIQALQLLKTMQDSGCKIYLKTSAEGLRLGVAGANAERAISFSALMGAVEAGARVEFGTTQMKMDLLNGTAKGLKEAGKDYLDAAGKLTKNPSDFFNIVRTAEGEAVHDFANELAKGLEKAKQHGRQTTDGLKAAGAETLEKGQNVLKDVGKKVEDAEQRVEAEVKKQRDNIEGAARNGYDKLKKSPAGRFLPNI